MEEFLMGAIPDPKLDFIEIQVGDIRRPLPLSKILLPSPYPQCTSEEPIPCPTAKPLSALSLRWPFLVK
jgi:hypothetical protein